MVYSIFCNNLFSAWIKLLLLYFLLFPVYNWKKNWSIPIKKSGQTGISFWAEMHCICNWIYAFWFWTRHWWCSWFHHLQLQGLHSKGGHREKIKKKKKTDFVVFIHCRAFMEVGSGICNSNQVSNFKPVRNSFQRSELYSQFSNVSFHLPAAISRRGCTCKAVLNEISTTTTSEKVCVSFHFIWILQIFLKWPDFFSSRLNAFRWRRCLELIAVGLSFLV